LIKATQGERIDAWVREWFPFLFVRPLDPNLLSALGVLISLGAATAFALGWLRLGALLFIGGGFFDLVDGVVARHQGRSTLFGAFLDSTLDRLVDMAILVGIAIHYAQRQEIGLVLLTASALVLGVLVSYAKARAECTVPALTGGLLERGERFGLIVAGALFGLLPVALALVAAGSAITVVQRMTQAHRLMSALEASRGGSAAGPSANLGASSAAPMEGRP
jgi:phosphatidylglycerophosphate synthase